MKNFASFGAFLCAFGIVVATGAADQVQQHGTGSRVARNLDVSTILSGLATQFFNKGGQNGVQELSATSDKPSILQKYLGGALTSGLLGSLGGGGGGGGGGLGNSGGNGLSGVLIQQLVQMIMNKFGGGGGGGIGGGGSSPQRSAMTASNGGDLNGGLDQSRKSGSGGILNALLNNNSGNSGSNGQSSSSGSSAGKDIMKTLAKQLLKA